MTLLSHGTVRFRHHCPVVCRTPHALEVGFLSFLASYISCHRSVPASPRPGLPSSAQLAPQVAQRGHRLPRASEPWAACAAGTRPSLSRRPLPKWTPATERSSRRVALHALTTGMFHFSNFQDHSFKVSATLGHTSSLTTLTLQDPALARSTTSGGSSGASRRTTAASFWRDWRWSSRSPR